MNARAASRSRARRLGVAASHIEDCLLALAGVCIALILAVVVANSLGRHILGSPLAGAVAAVELFLAPAATYFALSAALRNRHHVGVSILVTRMPPRVRRFSQILLAIMAAVVFGVLSYQAALRTIDAMSTGRLDEQTGIPLYVAYSVVLIGCAAVALRSLWMALTWWRDGNSNISMVVPDGLPVAREPGKAS